MTGVCRRKATGSRRVEAGAAACLIDECPSECGLIRAIFAEVDSCCAGCPVSAGDEGCPEDCLAYRLLRLVPAEFDFGEVRRGEA